MAPNPAIDPEYIKEKAKKDLLDLLEGIRGKKNLVIDQDLAGSIGLFVKFSTLQQYGVDKVFFLERNNVDSSQKNVVFLTRSENADRALAVAEQIKKLQQSSQIEHEFSVFVVPRRTLVANKIFEEAGVLGDISLEEFPLYFLPIDNDVLSLELDDSFADLFLRKDPTCIHTAARAFLNIQQKYGLFPRVIGKGDNAHRLMELLFHMRAEATAEDRSEKTKIGMLPSSTIESLIIIDREVDFGTLLLSQLTYEGLLDESFGIKDNQIEVDTSIVGPPPGQQTANSRPALKRKIMVDSSDKLYAQLRDANFAVVGSLLNKVARRMQTDMQNRHSNMTTAELRQLVNNLPGLQAEQQSLKIHTGLAEEVMKLTKNEIFSRGLEVEQNLAAGADPTSQHDTIEELIARDTPIRVVLRLLCLESCISGGLKQKDLDHFRTMILQAYGYQHVLTLDALERMQLLTVRTGNVFTNVTTVNQATSIPRTNYNYLRKALRLIVDEVDEAEPNDIAYVYSGYAPLSVRLVQCVLQKQYLQSFTKSSTQAPSNPGVGSAAHGWQGFEDALKAAKGQTFNKVQKGDEAVTKARAILGGTAGQKTVVVMFLGGITRTEIAALRFLQKADPSKKILICTTSIINGNRLIDAALEERTFGGDDVPAAA